MLDYAGVPHMGGAEVVNRGKDCVGYVVQLPAAVLCYVAVGYAILVHVGKQSRNHLVNHRFIHNREFVLPFCLWHVFGCRAGRFPGWRYGWRRGTLYFFRAAHRDIVGLSVRYQSLHFHSASLLWHGGRLHSR